MLYAIDETKMNSQQSAKEERQTKEENRQNQSGTGKNDKSQPHIMPSETDNNKVSGATNKAGDPGRTPGKAEGEEI